MSSIVFLIIGLVIILLDPSPPNSSTKGASSVAGRRLLIVLVLPAEATLPHAKLLESLVELALAKRAICPPVAVARAGRRVGVAPAGRGPTALFGGRRVSASPDGPSGGRGTD